MVWRFHTWNEAKAILKMATATKDDAWETPSYDQILGVGLYKSGSASATRLHKIIVSETAFVIWKLRNAAVIRGERITTARAINTLHDTLRRRAKVDLDILRLPEFTSPAKQKEAAGVRASWEGLVEAIPGRLRWIPSDHG